MEADTGYRFKINAVLSVDLDDYATDYSDYSSRVYFQKDNTPKYSEPWVKKRKTPKILKGPRVEAPVADGNSVRFVNHLSKTTNFESHFDILAKFSS